MGYSERSLRRLVDRIEDGTTNPEEEPVLIAGTSHPGTVSDEAEGAPHFMNNEEDVEVVGCDTNSHEESMQERLHDTTEAASNLGPSLDEREIEEPPAYMSDELYARVSQLDNRSSVEGVDFQFSLSEICSYQLIALLEEAKAPRNCYDHLIALLKKQKRMGFSVTDTLGRDTFVKRMKQKFNYPVVHTIPVGPKMVIRFSFVQNVQNLLDVAGKLIKLIDPENISTSGTTDELWNTKWMVNLFRSCYPNFDKEKEAVLPIILYSDKTGTDANQHYHLEPWIFSFATICREQRENRRFWRHLGFVPSSDHLDKALPKLQFYHQCLGEILSELKEAQRNPPLVKIQCADGVTREFRAHFPIMIVMGDQLSQDTICARKKSNAGGACRVHRSCNCSYLSVDDSTTSCTSVSKETLEHMTSLALISDSHIQDITGGNRSEMLYMKKLRTMNEKFLAKPYGTYPVVNGFDGANFGSWTGGIYEATLDDFMHSTELGVVKSLNEVVFKGLTKSETKEVEFMMRSFLSGVRSSCRSTYPRWRLSDGFSRQTLMTSTERVGSLFSLCLALQSEEIRGVISAAHSRQRKKYMSFPQPTPMQNAQDAAATDYQSVVDSEVEEDESDEEEEYAEEQEDVSEQEVTEEGESKSITEENVQSRSDLYFEQHLQRNLSRDQIRHALEHAKRHGYDLNQLLSFDILQLNQFVAQAHLLFKGRTQVYPKRSIEGYFDLPDENAEVNIPDNIMDLAVHSVEVDQFDVLGGHRFFGVDSVVPKHMCRKRKRKGTGNTEAVLNSDLVAVTLFLEQMLCFHAFAKYSSSLPIQLRDNFANVHFGCRSLVTYIERQFYRGDDSIDYRTTKLHCHRRFGHNYEEMRCVVHFSTELGERLLKTEAKGISRTAQQRGEATFHYQTAERIAERQVLESFGDVVEDIVSNNKDQEVSSEDRFARRLPHFIFSRTNQEVKAMTRHGKVTSTDQTTGTIAPIIKKTLLHSEPHMTDFEIYTEAILRNESGYVRACPMYRNESAFYDFVMIKWEVGVFPGKVVCFYKKQLDDETGPAGLFALVHVVDERTAGKVKGFSNTLLCTHYNMSYNRRQPTLYTVPLESIEHTVLAFPHEPNPTVFNHNKLGVTIVRPRNEWAYLWLAWNDILQEENSTELHIERKRRDNRRFVSLNTKSIIEKVREKLDEMLANRNQQ